VTTDAGERIRTLLPGLIALRHELHAHPETAFEEYRTAARVTEELERCGLEVHTGLAGTGVVGTLRAGGGSRSIGLRADLDALDLEETSGLPYASTRPGKMHACGHDGHTTMLLGAARCLAASPEFDGVVHFIFQPAEENVAGGRRMVEEGLFERFPMEAVFGMHNMPGLELGRMGVRSGPVMASADFFELILTGLGGHGAYPHKARDPILAAAHIITAWQGIVSRQVDPIESAVISVTRIHGGHTTNVIPERVTLAGTTRAFKIEIQDLIEQSMRQLAEGIAAAHGLDARLGYERRYPSTVNSEREANLALEAMLATVGPDNVRTDLPPTMGAEDFGWMLRARPGAYVVIGNGTGGPALHNPGYDFNDAAIPTGVAYWVNLVRHLLPPGGKPER